MYPLIWLSTDTSWSTLMLSVPSVVCHRHQKVSCWVWNYLLVSWRPFVLCFKRKIHCTVLSQRSQRSQLHGFTSFSCLRRCCPEGASKLKSRGDVAQGNLTHTCVLSLPRARDPEAPPRPLWTPAPAAEVAVCQAPSGVCACSWSVFNFCGKWNVSFIIANSLTCLTSFVFGHLLHW